MRNVPEPLNSRLNQAIQTQAKNADPKVILRLRRAQIPIETGDFLDRSLIKIGASGALMTDCSIAVEHSHLNKDGSIWAALVEDNICKIFKAKNAAVINDRSFIELDFQEPAIACSVSFDAKTVLDKTSKWQYITDKNPWIFWVTTEGALWGRLYGANQDVLLASSSVSKVASVRGAVSVVPMFNMGLIVFFLTEAGTIFYRQYIDGVWYDAEQINFGPENTMYVDISVSRTWDYRIVIQAITQNGFIFEYYSQYAGVGTHDQEHIAVNGVSVEHVLTELVYKTGYETEHLSVADVDETHALWLAGAPVIVYAYEGGFGLEDFYPGEEDVPIDYE